MRLIWQGIYCYVAQPLMRLGLSLAARKNKKLAQTLAGQQGWSERLQRQLQQRSADRKLIWFHVASAGEYLQACPVMERLMLRGHECVLTITSVSGYQWATKRKLHPSLVAIEYLPLDTRQNVRTLLEMIRPDALVYVKFDLWPNLIWESRKRGIPQFLISATLHEKSKRVTSGLARSLYRSLYQSLDGIFAVSDQDTERFLATCPNHPNTHTVGDTRFDSVLDRRASIKPPALPEYLKQSPVLILGSCWPQDEAVVMDGICQALRTFPEMYLIVAPHEIDSAHLEDLNLQLAEFGVQRLSQFQSLPDQRVVLVDSVGQLSALYCYADIAFVGGAFGKGVHNVMEPSAMGVPAIMGPFYQNSPEAMQLVEKGKAFSIQDGQQFTQLLFDLLSRPAYRQKAGEDAARFIEAQAGASDACYKLIEEVIE
ncbi:MAG: 3-deoxy-D-manno-octulosonic acid transferase [Gammaproteobacteria bacterium]|nr:3-deoxy-D-manno-octulosonic acid transferase [Gammaproteobacteria bacterium]